MRIIKASQPFEVDKYFMLIRKEFKGLPYLVVSGDSFVQLPHFKNKRTRPLKVLDVKQDGRLRYIRYDGKKLSRSELKSRSYTVNKKVKIPYVKSIIDNYGINE